MLGVPPSATNSASVMYPSPFASDREHLAGLSSDPPKRLFEKLTHVTHELFWVDIGEASKEHPEKEL